MIRVTKTGLHIEESGAGDPVVLLHSSGLSGRQWRKIVPVLVDRGLRVIVPDLTGHGASEAWAEPKGFTFQIDVDRVVTLLGEVGPAHVVGHSYGGLIAIKAALAAQESIRSLVLYDPVAFGVLDPVADASAIAEVRAVDTPWGSSADDRERWLARFVSYWGGDDAWSALREEARAEFRRVGWVVHEGVQSLVADAASAENYRVFRFPVRLINGEKTPLAARRVSQRLHDAIPGASIVTIPGAGHLGPVTHADLTNAAIADAIAPRRARA